MINKKIPDQFYYNGRYVNTEHFRTFVYNKDGEKLAENYQQYQDLISSGLWFSSKEAIPKETIDVVEEIKQKASVRKLRGDDAFTIPNSA